MYSPVYFLINRKWLLALWSPRDNNLCFTSIHFFNNPVSIKDFINNHTPKGDTFNQRGNTYCVVAITMHLSLVMRRKQG